MGIQYAVLADIVGSRQLADRAAAQEEFLAALRRASDGLALTQMPWATTGDEFQLVAADLATAVNVTLRAHLILPEGRDLRFGIGAGSAKPLNPDQPTGIQDGSAWWSAREAIDHVHAMEDSGLSWLRTGWRAGEDTNIDHALVASVNAALTLRDHIIARLKPKERRITAGLLFGRTQVEIAKEERSSQSAISQTFHRCGGAALLHSRDYFAALIGGDK
ncbi:MAG: SatD family protein [Actinomycetaceae bacterium]|nr:SatD family protein [Actinomycetaceae bacterium]